MTGQLYETNLITEANIERLNQIKSNLNELKGLSINKGRDELFYSFKKRLRGIRFGSNYTYDYSYYRSDVVEIPYNFRHNFTGSKIKLLIKFLTTNAYLDNKFNTSKKISLTYYKNAYREVDLFTISSNNYLIKMKKNHRTYRNDINCQVIPNMTTEAHIGRIIGLIDLVLNQDENLIVLCNESGDSQKVKKIVGISSPNRNLNYLNIICFRSKRAKSFFTNYIISDLIKRFEGMELIDFSTI